MKKIILSLLSIGILSTGAQAATFLANNTVGFVDSTNAPVNAGIVRFGIFQNPGNVAGWHSAGNMAALEADFIQVLSLSIDDFNNSSTAGEWNVTAQTFNGAGSFEGVAYDLSTGAGNTTNVANDIAGSQVYTWIMNNVNPANATEHGIFTKVSQIWQDNDNVVPVNTSLTYTTTSCTPSMLVGALNGGPILAGNTANSHQLAAITAVPEPSRGLLALAGAAGVMFRRRRAAK